MKLIIVSGRSGSGKSICLHVLEDLDYYCIDNLPLVLLSSCVAELQGRYQDIAVSIDARNASAHLDNFEQTILELKKSEVTVEIIFLDADNQTLLQRYSQTHRKHPLTKNNLSLIEALDQEREFLRPITMASDQTINTTHMNLHQLRTLLYERLKSRTEQHISLFFTSFGYKFGLPSDVDFIFDVRCLANPHWIPNLSKFSGKDIEVESFLQSQPKTKLLLRDLIAFLEQWLPHYEISNRRYISIGIGCTGGQHRSVYITEKLFEHFSIHYENIQIRHRELT